MQCDKVIRIEKGAGVLRGAENSSQLASESWTDALTVPVTAVSAMRLSI
jgi:hypothetical protein